MIVHSLMWPNGAYHACDILQHRLNLIISHQSVINAGVEVSRTLYARNDYSDTYIRPSSTSRKIYCDPCRGSMYLISLVFLKLLKGACLASWPRHTVSAGVAPIKLYPKRFEKRLYRPTRLFTVKVSCTDKLRSIIFY